MAVSKGIRKSISRTNKTREQREKYFDLSPEYESDLVEKEQRNSNTLPRIGTNFTEAVGKVVAYINLFNNPPEWQEIEVCFTDGTLLHFELLVTYARVRPRYMEVRHGESELIRDYGILLTEGEKKAHQQALEV